AQRIGSAFTSARSTTPQSPTKLSALIATLSKRTSAAPITKPEAGLTETPGAFLSTRASTTPPVSVRAAQIKLVAASPSYTQRLIPLSTKPLTVLVRWVCADLGPH